MLMRFWPNAWNSLYRYLDRNNSKRLRRTQFYNVPANTGYVMPADMGIQSMGKPESIYDRTIGLTYTATVLAISTGPTSSLPSAVDLSIPGHTLTQGQQVVAFGFGRQDSSITDDINGDWYISLPDPNNPAAIRLNGCPSTDLGNGVGSTGIISTGAETFPTIPMEQVYDFANTPLTANNARLSQWKWENGVIRFLPSSSDRQIKIVYMLSGTPAQFGSVGIDDSGDALSLFLAATFAAAKGFQNKSQSLFMRALGNPSGDTTNIRGGAFYELAQLGAQEINRTRVVVGRYRPRRNVGPIRQNW
jgi:hypothetical protein